MSAALAGCAVTSATYTPLNAAPHALRGRTPEQIEVFSSAPPERPHVDVGLITVEEGYDTQTPATMVGRLRNIAGERGCDALVILPPSSKSSGDGTGVSSFKVYSGTCVVYR